MNKDSIARVTAGDRRAVMHSFSSLPAQASVDPLIVARAEDIYLYDANGRSFVDAGSGLWCCNVGYGRAEIAEAMAEASRRFGFLMSFSIVTTDLLVELSTKLLSIAPPGMSKVLLSNGGSEANETQIKIVRAYNNILGRPKKKKIIARRGGYHGASIGAGSLTGLEITHRLFDLPIDGILHTDPPDYYRRADRAQSPDQFVQHLANRLEQMILAEGPDTIAAFIAEPIMASGGVIVPPKGYYEAIHEVLRKYDVLLIADEVVTGFGRVGEWFASPVFAMQPDLVTCAKGITSGYFPMAANLIGGRIWDVLSSDKERGRTFGHGFTTAGHPVGCAAALANMEIIERERLLENSRTVGAYLFDRLRTDVAPHPLVGEVRSRQGLLMAVELDADKSEQRPFENAYEVVGGALARACMEEGLTVRGGHGKAAACLAPPLTLTKDQADEIVKRLLRALDRLAERLVTKGLWTAP